MRWCARSIGGAHGRDGTVSGFGGGDGGGNWSGCWDGLGVLTWGVSVDAAGGGGDGTGAFGVGTRHAGGGAATVGFGVVKSPGGGGGLMGPSLRPRKAGPGKIRKAPPKKRRPPQKK